MIKLIRVFKVVPQQKCVILEVSTLQVMKGLESFS